MPHWSRYEHTIQTLLLDQDDVAAFAQHAARMAVRIAVDLDPGMSKTDVLPEILRGLGRVPDHSPGRRARLAAEAFEPVLVRCTNPDADLVGFLLPLPSPFADIALVVLSRAVVTRVQTAPTCPPRHAPNANHPAVTVTGRARLVDWLCGVQ